jgi:hypothetical protein
MNSKDVTHSLTCSDEKIFYVRLTDWNFDSILCWFSLKGREGTLR